MKTPFDFSVKRSKVKVTRVVNVCPQICFRIVTSVWISRLYSNSTYVSLITQGKPLLSFGSKDKRSKVRVVNRCLQIYFQMITPVWISWLYSDICITHHSGKAPVDVEVNVLYLEDGNVHRLLLKNKTASMFFSQRTFF